MMSDFLLPPVSEWADWGPIFTDAALWRPVVERVWADDPGLPAATGILLPTRIEAGFPGTCAVFIVDNRAVIKFFPPMVARDFDRERTVYRLISGLTSHLPRLLAQGKYHDRVDWPYLVISRLPGRAWREARALISREAQTAVLRELGRLVRGAHDTPLSADGTWPAHDSWPAFVETRLPQAIVDLRAGAALPARVIQEIETALEASDWFAEPPRLLNADLTEDHLLVGQRGGQWRMTGLIDWADAEVGDPLYEWVTLWFSICRRDGRLFRAFLAGYDPKLQADEIRLDRLLAFTVLHRFGTNMINEALSPAERRQVKSLHDLQRMLFPGLGR